MQMRDPARGRRSVWTYAWVAAAVLTLAIVLVRQSWDGSAALHDPGAAPRAVASRAEFGAEEEGDQIPEGTGSGFVWDTFLLPKRSVAISFFS
ncbi:MAG TPA: hypothetical protein VFU31_08410 [Candidatus Binatia bacterium]|nr:hypothetical protein [Candidatus Binatia bacterium]